jgi:hypothetical protein
MDLAGDFVSDPIWLGSYDWKLAVATGTCLDWTGTSGMGLVYDPTLALMKEPLVQESCANPHRVLCVGYVEVEP